MEYPLVSIIIPLKSFNEYIKEAVKHYEELLYPDFEIIILPDHEESEKLSNKLNIRIIPTGPIGPAEKRDIGAKLSRGSILAFIDDDAYPDRMWLKRAVDLLLSSNDIGAVGGPGVTPPGERFWRRISGNVYSSFWMSGPYRKRYIPIGNIHEDYDIPSVNLIVKREIFERVGGFDSSYYPGEDTKLCLSIKKIGYRILYDPQIIVYHHRRYLWFGHFKQISQYAFHRGFFVKKYPETSLKPGYYLLPSLFFLGVLLGWIPSLFHSLFIYPYIGSLMLYFIGSTLFSKGNLLEKPFTVLSIFLSHLTYGFFFLKGFLANDISENREVEKI